MSAQQEPAQSPAKQGAGAGQKKPRQRRDSGKDARDAGVQTLREFANSNSTMNAFIGGRQKSWMTPGMSPTAPTLPSSSLSFPKKTNVSPTTPAVPQSPSNTSATPLQRWAAPASVPPLSTSPVKPQSASEGISNKEENVLPSPAPSDDVVSPVVPAAKEPQAVGLAEGRPENVEVPSMGHSVGIIHTAPATGIEGGGTEVRAAPESEIVQLNSNDDNIVGNQSMARPTSTPAPQLDQTGLRVQTGASQNKRRRIEVPAQRNGVNVPHAINASSPSSPAFVIPFGSLPSQTVSRSSAPLLKSYLPAIAAHVSQSGGAQALDRTVDLYRIRLLEQACASEDSMYLALHQILCLESLRPGTVVHIEGFGAHQKSALQIIGMLLYPNERLAQQRLQWFATFPSPLEQLLRVSTLYQAAVREVQLLLTVLPTELRKLESLCIQRGYPPLTYELVNNLQLKSKTFQRVVFKAVHQTMWKATYDEWFDKVEETYRQEQQEYYEVISRINTPRPLPVPRVQERIRQIVMRYQYLRREQIQSQTRSGAPGNLPSPRASTTHVQTTTSQATSVPVRSQTVASQTPQLGPFYTTYPARPPTLHSNSHGQQVPTPLQVELLAPSPFPSSATFTFPQLPVANSSIHQNAPARSPPNVAPRAQTSQANLQFGQGLQSSVHHPNHRSLPSDSYGSARSGAGLRTIYPASPYTNPSSAVTQTSAVPPPTTQPRSTLTSHRPPMPSQQQQTAQGQGSNSVLSAPTLPAQVEHLLMPLGLSSTPTNMIPNPTVTALHQVHLRSPRLVPVDQDGKELKTTRVYRTFKEFAQPPFLLPMDNRVVRQSFNLSQEGFDKLPQAHQWPSLDYLPAGSVREGTLMYRLRSCVLDPQNDPCNESQWSLKEHVWPDHIFFDFNGEELSVRRKYHHGKDLPLDLSTYVREGTNTISIVTSRPGHGNSTPYAFAVETIEFTTHDTVMRDCAQTSPIPAQQTLGQIIASLTADPTDEELTVVNGQVTISVTDPFTSRIFNIPVRSTTCRHRDCFDLETFLQTRKTSTQTPTESLQLVSKIDDWRCPLCGADARPKMLRVDEFLQQVQARLEELGQLDVKSIVVMQDGTWKANLPSPERRRTIPSTTGGPTSNVEGTPGTGESKQTATSPMDLGGNEKVVIELDD